MAEAAQTQTDSNQQQQTREVNVLDVPVSNENVALNVMVALLNMAQRRGVFTMQESAKAWECVKVFVRDTAPATENVTLNVNEKDESSA